MTLDHVDQRFEECLVRFLDDQGLSAEELVELLFNSGSVDETKLLIRLQQYRCNNGQNVFTFCPPGPEARTNCSVISHSSIWM